MQRVRFVIAAIVVCATVAAGVAPALAGSSGNPQWSVAGTTLSSGESREIKGEGPGTQKFHAGEVTVACSATALESGATIIGGSGSTPGTGSEQLVYTGCQIRKSATEEVVSGCAVYSVGAAAGTMKTAKLAARLGYVSQTAAEHEEPNTVTVLKPETGSAYLQVELTGESCPLPGAGKYTVEGEIALKNPESGVEKAKHAVEAPSTSVKAFYLNSGGVAKEEKLRGLKMSTYNAVYVGEATTETISGERWGVVH